MNKVIIAFLLLIVLVLSIKFAITPRHPYVKVPGPKDATLLIMDGDDIVQEIELKNNFVFYIKGSKLFYTDTTQEGFWTSDIPFLAALGKAHKEAVRKIWILDGIIKK